LHLQCTSEGTVCQRQSIPIHETVEGRPSQWHHWPFWAFKCASRAKEGKLRSCVVGIKCLMIWGGWFRSGVKILSKMYFKFMILIKEWQNTKCLHQGVNTTPFSISKSNRHKHTHFHWDIRPFLVSGLPASWHSCLHPVCGLTGPNTNFLSVLVSDLWVICQGS